jgi:hypothetical protein
MEPSSLQLTRTTIMNRKGTHLHCGPGGETVDLDIPEI